ncbi:MAG: hypothetical protein E7476_08815 [Ruminococcaceae bacterium]|nr:hypothetical protein [Oscillospiraceae bacterium]
MCEPSFAVDCLSQFIYLPLHFVTSVHKDVTDRLKKINPTIYTQVKAVLEQNKSERHIRGGIATREKYARIKAHH